jgi:hypothetical protein
MVNYKHNIGCGIICDAQDERRTDVLAEMINISLGVVIIVLLVAFIVGLMAGMSMTTRG